MYTAAYKNPPENKPQNSKPSRKLPANKKEPYTENALRRPLFKIVYDWYTDVYPATRKSIYRDIMTRITTLSVPKKDEGAWIIWSAHPANQKTSAALMRLIRKDLKENPDMYDTPV